MESATPRHATPPEVSKRKRRGGGVGETIANEGAVKSQLGPLAEITVRLRLGGAAVPRAGLGWAGLGAGVRTRLRLKAHSFKSLLRISNPNLESFQVHVICARERLTVIFDFAGL